MKFPGRTAPFSFGDFSNKLTVGILLTLCLAFVFPFCWMVFASFKSDAAIFSPFPFWPDSWDGSHYVALLTGKWIPYPRQFLNSLSIAMGQTILATTFACSAGYVFAKFTFPGRKPLFAMAVLTVLIPRQVLLLPLFSWMHTLALLDNPLAVILPGSVSGIGILWFTAVFRRLPDGLADMARCEGAGEYRIYVMTLPLIKPALIAFALIQFILSWQEHLIPLVMISTENRFTAPMGLSSLNAGNFRVPYGILMAGCALTLIPTALLFIFTRRHFRSALKHLTEP